MNSLSWFLYIANMVDNLNSVTGPLLFIFTIAFLGAIAGRIIVGLGAKCGEDDFKEFLPHMKSLFRLAACVWAVFAILFVAGPDKKTMYAMAAAQVGEQVMKSERVNGIVDDATKALQIWIKNQIEPERKK